MNVIETTAPLSIDNLKLYFSDKSISYIIDYEKSSLKGKKLLTYLSNLDLPIDIKWSDSEELYDLLKDYFEFEMIVNVKSLELKALHIILEHKHILEKRHEKFIEDNLDIIKKWESKIDSLSIYNMYSINCEEFKKFVETFPEDNTEELIGINFVSLIKHTDFNMCFNKINESGLKYYSSYFNKYMFNGNNLFHYWANENNNMFLLTIGICEKMFVNEEYSSAKIKDLQELKIVPSI